jgi:hypothetical protein
VAVIPALGCADVLGIPTDPELVAQPPVEMPANEPSSEPGPVAPAAGGAPSTPVALDRPNSDGVVPPDQVAGIDGSAKPPSEPPNTSVTTEEPPPVLPTRDAGVDAGAGTGESAEPAIDAGIAPPAPDDCQGEFARVAVDVIFIVDNTATMATSNTELEQALPDLAEQLDTLLVDYRLILLSRHRDALRGTSEANDSSLCIDAPLGGVAACPSAAPALGDRFFHYSVPIGASDSFSQALATINQADPFGLTSIGWSEWLRPGARKLIVEISDTDSALSGADFISGLAAATPEHFQSDLANPGFVFHAILGLQQKAGELDLYTASEPVQPDLCDGLGNSPGSAGVIYQELSRATGGLRQSVCPAAAMPIRMRVLAADVGRRSVVACP